MAGQPTQDSSTSNEVFSRRRGLQQQQQQQQLGAIKAPTNNTQLNVQRQLDENKRRYLMQAAATAAKQRVHSLSAHKANQIKQKLGLTVTNASLISRSSRSADARGASSPMSASENLPVYSASGNDDDDDATQKGAQPDSSSSSSLSSAPGGIALMGAPLNSIPKTDFECTDKRGKFVTGLFADHKTGCQVWHLCSNNRKYSFLCPSGTIFNAKLRICDWRHNVKCEQSVA